MNLDHNSAPFDDEDNAGEQTMAVLSTLGGLDGTTPEGEPMGLDPESGKAKLSGSTLAVGVVVVLGVVVLFGMKMTLGAIGADSNPTDDIAQIDGFLATQNAALATGADGPIKAPDQESREVLDELNANPTDHQVPAEDVETNPFDISKIMGGDDKGTPTNTGSSDRAKAIERAKTVAGKLKVDSISGEIVFLNGNLYRIGDVIEDAFVLESVDGLTCIIRTTDEFKIPMRLRYR